MTGGRPPLALPLSAAVIDRSARALAKAKPLDWDAMPEHWRPSSAARRSPRSWRRSTSAAGRRPDGRFP
jgi:hypothetical protein